MFNIYGKLSYFSTSRRENVRPKIIDIKHGEILIDKSEFVKTSLIFYFIFFQFISCSGYCRSKGYSLYIESAGRSYPEPDGIQRRHRACRKEESI
jgi:hypothetical protein